MGLIKRQYIHLTVLLLINSIPIFAKSGFQPGTYQYAPSITLLEGVLQTRIYPGPPNYESVKQGDLAETIWLLQLMRPITVLDDKDLTSNNETEYNLQEIQLVIQNEGDEQILKRAIGHSVKLTGTLYHAWSGHHHLKILMDVKSHRIKK